MKHQDRIFSTLLMFLTVLAICIASFIVENWLMFDVFLIMSIFFGVSVIAFLAGWGKNDG
jgi:hypothetical protein